MYIQFLTFSVAFINSKVNYGQQDFQKNNTLHLDNQLYLIQYHLEQRNDENT